MSNIKGIVTGLPTVLSQAMITLDVDANAERFVIYDRVTGHLIHNKLILQPIEKTIVPLRYSSSNSLIIGILDDNAVYDCKFVDGVQAEIIDGLVTSIHT